MYIPPFDELENASKEDLLKIIRKTERKMRCLRYKMEHPFYNDEEKLSPTDLTVYKCDRDFLNMAKADYYLKGGELIVGRNEQRVKKFNDKVNEISKITFTLTRFTSPSEEITVDLSGDGVNVKPYSYRIFKDKKDFLVQLKEIKVGDWRKTYSPKRYKIYVLDGSSWSLEFEYKNGKLKSYYGYNAYPYNFEELLDLMGLRL